jgi:hypothetical protein
VKKERKLLRDSRMNLLFLLPHLCDSTLGFALLAWTWGPLSLWSSSCAYKALLGALFNGACQGFFIILGFLKRSDTSQCQLGESLLGWKVLLQKGYCRASYFFGLNLLLIFCVG